MRAVLLALALVCLAPAARADEAGYIAQVAALGPQDLRVSEGLGGILSEARARVFVEAGVLVIEVRRDGQTPPEVLRYDGKGIDRSAVWSDAWPQLDFTALCDGGGTLERYEIGCYSRSDLMSRALRPPHTVWTLRWSADGLRVVREGRRGERLTLTPLKPAKKGAPWLEAGLPANLGDALGQLATYEDGGLGGGASGGGDWYGSDLWVREVRGLDFKLERTVWPDRGGRSDQVPATWAFDYQGDDKRNHAELAWMMVRRRKGVREADFWCVGRQVSASVDIACHKGGRPSDVRGKPDIAFKLEPFPKWKIHVEQGADNAFSSVGTSRLETLPYP